PLYFLEYTDIIQALRFKVKGARFKVRDLKKRPFTLHHLLLYLKKTFYLEPKSHDTYCSWD
ncbi:MAG: hypothetical protein ACXW01_10230, partial [Methylobacter sp.]